MITSKISTLRHPKTRLFGTLSGLLMLAAGATTLGPRFATAAPAGTQQQLVVTPFADARFVPFDPKQPSAGGYAVLSGDPAKGPSQMLFKYGRGKGELHRHSSDYQAVAINGQAKHWAEAEGQGKAKVLGPGSYWAQPAGALHGDNCLTDECLLFIQWSGKMD